MLNQLYYALRNRLNLRIWLFAVTIGLNLVFGICGGLDLYGLGGKITAVTLSSFAVCAMLIGSIICDGEQIRSLFSAPAAYSVYLAPVPAWQVVLSRILVMTVLDWLALAVSSAGVVLQSFILAGYQPSFTSSNKVAWDQTLHLLVIFFLLYLLVLVTIYFAGALCKSVFFRFKYPVFLGLLLTCGVLYILSWLDMVLAPFAMLKHWGMFWSFQIPLGFTVAGTIYTLLTLAKIAAIFFGATYLMERKINV